jgi:hypothetical protein
MITEEPVKFVIVCPDELTKTVEPVVAVVAVDTKLKVF